MKNKNEKMKNEQKKMMSKMNNNTETIEVL